MKDNGALELNKVSKGFDQVQAVEELSLQVNSDEVYALIGPNGAGKTTTVKMITGLLAADKGTIKIFEHLIDEEPVEAKRYLGYIPDNPYVYPYLTGREFLQFTGDLFGIDREKTNIRIKELLKLYHLEDLIDGLFSEYSRGNQQKTVILANLLHEPKLLVIDEPIVGLDVQSQRVTRKLFKKFTENGGAILLCTHTLTFAQEVADRIGVIDEGKLVAEGSLKELRKMKKHLKASLEELYLEITK
jgi:ABC-2 type transport system ATP-binding protein